MPDDYYVSQYSGEEIDERLTAAHNAVRYDAAQSLTDAQKAQALTNIAAAPSGYGLGGVPKLLTADDDINAWHGNGYYYWNSLSVPQNAPTLLRSDGTGMYMYEFGYAEGFTQVCGCAVDSSPSLICRQVFYGVPLQFGEWEYIDPPMVVGVEYRTTERNQGKPVYRKLVNFGTLPNATLKQVDHNVSNADQIGIDMSMSYSGGGGDSLFPLNPFIKKIDISGTTINVETTFDLSSYSAVFCLCYTKTTD